MLGLYSDIWICAFKCFITFPNQKYITSQFQLPKNTQLLAGSLQFGLVITWREDQTSLQWMNYSILFYNYLCYILSQGDKQDDPKNATLMACVQDRCNTFQRGSKAIHNKDIQFGHDPGISKNILNILKIYLPSKGNILQLISCTIITRKNPQHTSIFSPSLASKLS